MARNFHNQRSSRGHGGGHRGGSRGGRGRGRGHHGGNRPAFRGGAGHHHHGGDRHNRPPKSDHQHKYQRDPAGLSDLKEEQVFITEYVTAGEGFRGILKSRFSDFHVNEVDCEGAEAVLTDLTLPTAPKDEQDEKSNATVEEELQQLISKEKLEMIRSIANHQGKCSNIAEIDVTEMSKEDRGNIHNGAKTLFGQAIVGSTVTKGDRKLITFAKYDKHTVKDRRQKWLWPHPFTTFMLYKENIDTIQATSQLAELLHCSPSAFAYAGTKDRRAKTTQWMSVKLFDPAKIVGAAKKIRNLRVGNFCFKPTTLKLGLLRGNRFRVALRQVSAEEATLRESMENFREKGFINYFGLQRFGNNASIPTYKIGIEMLKGSWTEACQLILKPRDGDPWFMQQIRETWQKTGDAQSALEKFKPSNKGVEKLILEWLASHPNDFKGALERLPRNMRLLYCHSYQSLIWNRIASRRIKEFGTGLIPGDLVYVDKSAEEAVDDDVAVEDASAEAAETTPAEDSEEPTPPTESSPFKNLVKPLTEADIASGQYSIFDVVLPLAGHDITYPANECGKWYEELLAEDGLSSEKLKRKQKKESLVGAYRKLFLKPINLDWKLLGYEKPSDTLILSDLEKLNGEKEPESKPDAPQKALILDFQLPSSAYATMALREVLKVDTSALHQRSLEQQDQPTKPAQDESPEITDATKEEDKLPAQDDEPVTATEAKEEVETPLVENDDDGEPPAEKKPKLEE